MIISNKHIGIIFHPRTGSHVLRHFLADSLQLMNIGELFNTGVEQQQIIIDESAQSAFALPGTRKIYDNLVDINLQTNAQLEMLGKLSNIDKSTVFGILVRSYRDNYPSFIEKLSKQTNIQFLHLARADVLYGIISTIICDETAVWHNQSSSQQTRNIDRHKFKPDTILCHLNTYILEMKEIHEHFGEVPTIYYEQFQFNVWNLRNLFSNIPKKIVSIPYSKFIGNYKDLVENLDEIEDLVENLDEIEDLYEQFVNEHKEYFPQYFGKLPHITIPACQGKQPRDLSICGN